MTCGFEGGIASDGFWRGEGVGFGRGEGIGFGGGEDVGFGRGEVGVGFLVHSKKNSSHTLVMYIFT